MPEQEAVTLEPRKSNARAMTCDVAYICNSLQQACNNGLNGFAITLLAESFGDDMETKFPEGGICFTWPQDHRERPLWFVVTAQEPIIHQVDTARVRDLEADIARRDALDDAKLAGMAACLDGEPRMEFDHFDEVGAVWQLGYDDAAHDNNLEAGNARQAAEIKVLREALAGTVTALESAIENIEEEGYFGEAKLVSDKCAAARNKARAALGTEGK